MAGQQFIEACKEHPFIKITGLYASEKSAEKRYREVAAWQSENDIDEKIGDMIVKKVNEIENDLNNYDLVFSALPSEVAREIESKCAEKKPVFSTSSAFRYEEDTPLLIPEVNGNHASLIYEQKKKRGWKGFIVPGPNCTAVGLAVSLKPLLDNFGLKKVFMVSQQALSGAGYPGVASLDIIDNVIPYIREEEEKVQKEILKILGNGKESAKFKISCTCTRVNVKDGHLESVFVETEKEITPQLYIEAIENFNEKFSNEFKGLPSAPEKAIIVRSEPDRPQPRKDRNAGDGMSTVVGRIRKDEVFENGIKYVLLSHNTKKGAAKGSVFVVEYLRKKGLLE